MTRTSPPLRAAVAPARFAIRPVRRPAGVRVARGVWRPGTPDPAAGAGQSPGTRGGPGEAQRAWAAATRGPLTARWVVGLGLGLGLAGSALAVEPADDPGSQAAAAPSSFSSSSSSSSSSAVSAPPATAEEGAAAGLAYRLDLRVTDPAGSGGDSPGDSPGDRRPDAPGSAVSATSASASASAATAPPVDAEALARDLRALSHLATLADRPPLTRLGLERRLDADLDRFTQALRARGHYDASLSAQIAAAPTSAVAALAVGAAPGRPESPTDPGAAGEPTDPVTVAVTVDPGPLYRIARVEVAYPPGTDTRGLPLGPAAAGLTLGAAARAADVLAGEETLLTSLRRAARPLARAGERVVIVDHGARTMEITYRIDPGPRAAFGALAIEGLETVAAGHVRDMIPWRIGDPYDEAQVQAFRKRLAESRLFATITLEPGPAVDDAGRIPMRLVVTEAKHRTIALGLSYATDAGPGATARWEHRNIWGEGESLRLDAVAALSVQSLALAFRKPYFHNPDQALTATGRAAREDLDAYSGLVGEAAIGLDRGLGPDLRVTGALAVEYARLTWFGDDGPGTEETASHTLVGLPIGVQWDGSDNLLDPTRGARASVSLSPYAGQAAGDWVGFAIVDARASAYLPMMDDRVVAAGRLRLAGLGGADLDHIPPNHRLYAGGGGSVRGFGYQMIGPLDDGGDPLGGRSAVEIGGELRLRVTDTIAVVPFLEGGLVGPDPWPSLDEDTRWGAGLGLRYHTGFGPLRADFAVPLNPRDGDDWFQVYVSLGQAF